MTLCTSVAIDGTGVHSPYGFFACGAQIISCIILLCWSQVTTGAKMAAYCEGLHTLGSCRRPMWRSVLTTCAQISLEWRT